MATQYTVSYFDIRGLGELPRLVLVAAGQEFKDDRIPFVRKADGSFERGDWEERKKNTPFGQVPVLTLADGTQIAQSGAILRFLSRRHHLSGVSDVESALLDAVYDHLGDIRKSYYNAKSDAAKAAEFWAKTFPEGMIALAKNIKGNNHIGSSNTLSYVDITLYYMLWSLRTENKEAIDAALGAHAAVRGIFESVPKVPQIATYLAARKETPF